MRMLVHLVVLIFLALAHASPRGCDCIFNNDLGEVNYEMLSQIDHICQDLMWPRHSELPALGLAAMSGLYSLWPGRTLVKTMISFQFSFRSNAWFLLTRSSQLFLPAPSHCSPIFATLTCPSLKLRESRSLLLMITESLRQWSLVATALSLCPSSSLTLITHWSQLLLTTTNCP